MEDDEISRALRRSQPAIASDRTWLRIVGWALVVVAVSFFIGSATGRPGLLFLGVVAGGLGWFFLAGSRAGGDSS